MREVFVRRCQGGLGALRVGRLLGGAPAIAGCCRWEQVGIAAWPGWGGGETGWRLVRHWHRLGRCPGPRLMVDVILHNPGLHGGNMGFSSVSHVR